MSRDSRSDSKSILPAALAGIAAVGVGYAAYRFLKGSKPDAKKTAAVESSSKSSRSAHTPEVRRDIDEKTRTGASSKSATKNAAPSTVVRRVSTKNEPKISPDALPVSQGHLQWLPGLRAREQRILNLMPTKKEVMMSELQKHFPSVTVRTLRRDMDRLVAKGRVRKSGTTRSTTYIKT